jgi:hypothetical protein
MPVGGILALDLGVNLGWCRSENDSGSLRLKAVDQSRAIAFGRLVRWLNDEFMQRRPMLVVKESALPLQGFANTNNSQAGVQMAYGMHGLVEGLCEAFGIACEEVHPSTIRKHFIGQANFGDRRSTKAAVLRRCELLRYVPRGCVDDNRGDACAVYDWASAHFCKRGAKELYLFGEGCVRPSAPAPTKGEPSSQESGGRAAALKLD